MRDREHLTNATTPASYHATRRPTRREAVLVVAHADGWLEVFANKHVDAHIAMMPYVPTPAGEILAEEYVELSLPRRYRDVYWPSNRRAADTVRVIRPSDIANREHDLEMLRAIQRLRVELQEKTKRWTL